MQGTDSVSVDQWDLMWWTSVHVSQHIILIMVTTMTWCLPLCPSPPSLSLPSCLNWPCRWSEINNMSHNRSFFALELANREESVQFQTVSLRRRIAASQLSPNRRPLSKSASLINSSGIRQPASTKHLCLLRAWVGLLLALLGYVLYACLLKWHAVRC